MQRIFMRLGWLITLSSLGLGACQPTTGTPAAQVATVSSPSPLKVLAVESFLADIGQNVAGDRLQVETLIPAGNDPHTFVPTPQDLTRIAQSQVLIANGGGLEEWLEETLQNAGGERLLIEASTGLTSREPHSGEETLTEGEAHAHEGDPHFWLDPLNVIRYVENIRDGLISADPAGREAYTQNATAYVAKLNELDAWIRQQVQEIPTERRLIITDHESFGYFADRYGFEIIGALIPSVSSGAAPSAQQLAQLVERIRQSGAPAIFLQIGSNPKLAEQLAQETGVKVVTGLYTHSLTAPGGEASTYLDLIKHNVSLIVGALK